MELHAGFESQTHLLELGVILGRCPHSQERLHHAFLRQRGEKCCHFALQSWREPSSWKDEAEIFSNEWYLLCDRGLASSSCPILCVSCETFAKGNHFSLGVGELGKKKIGI